MPVMLYNTLSREKEEFIPLHPGEVRMYVCGVTPYDFCHIGHARATLVFEVIRRYLEFKGYKVTMVRNFTDVDDKIISRGAALGLSWREVADRFISHYYEDMGAIGVGPATIEPKATEHIPEMIEIVRSLEAKGYAYCIDGDVYFAVRRFSDYGKLSHRRIEEMLAGARVEVDARKKDPLDFALWKKSKEGEPSWASPWGGGRPGWHIECSAMSMKYLGETIDIHGGGVDLVFPHHENEIAQSEAHTGRQFARYWIHNGFVAIDSEKMSKSLGNFFTIREILARHEADALRLFLLSTHYRAPVDFMDRKLVDAEKALDRAQITLEKAEKIPVERGAGGSTLQEEVMQGVEAAFVEAMDDDFHTPRAIAALFEVIRHLNTSLAEVADDPSLPHVARRIRELGGILGLLQPRRNIFFVEDRDLDGPSRSLYEEVRERIQSASQAGTPPGPEDVQVILRWRAQARRRGDWTTSDEIRDWIRQAGVAVDDTREGFYWKYKANLSRNG